MNNTSTAGASDAVRNRRLVVLGVLLILAAAAITGGRLLYSRMQQARLTQDRPKDLQYGVSVYSPETAGKVQTQRQKYLAKASLLRDHWRVWAEAHQALLRQLRHSPPGDTATLMRVSSLLPSSAHLNQATGITLADIGIKPGDLDNPNAVRFTWQPGPLKQPIAAEWARTDPGAQAASDRTDDITLGMNKRQFQTYHNIALSMSMSAGRSRITLWADGRITEMVVQDQHIRGKPTIVDGLEKEIAPPYDFLK